MPAFVPDELTDHLVEMGVDMPSVQLTVEPALGREAHLAEWSDGALRIRGGDPRGVYHGVLSFLEALGCRWLAPGEWGTVIPRLDRIALPNGWRSAGQPAMLWRGLHICGTGHDQEGNAIFHYDVRTALWMARNRMNFKPIHIDEINQAAPLLARHLLSPLAFGHSYSAWIPMGDYREHPEWFPLVDGRRLREGQRCLSNSALRDAWAERLIAYAESHPDLPILSLAPNDGYRWCTCPDCTALDTPEDRERQELNRRHHHFSADLARRLRAACPTACLSTISYCNYLDPANDIEQEPNLAVSLCAMHARNRPLDDPLSPINQTFLRRLAAWREKAGKLFWSSYDLSYGGTLPQAYDAATARTIQVLRANGVAGLKTEVVPGEQERWRVNAWPLYLLARLCYAPDLDLAALRQDFCRHAYGPAANPAERILALHAEAMAELAGEDLHALSPEHLPRIYPPHRLKALTDAALADAGDAECRARFAAVQAQVEELTAACDAKVVAVIEAAPIRAPHLHGISFDVFDCLTWVPQRQRSNLLPFATPSSCSVAWTDEELWLAFRLGEPDVATALADTGEGSGAFSGSNVDCFIHPEARTGVYYQLAINIAGQVYSARCHQRQWNSDYKLEPTVELRHHRKRWDLLIGISWERLGVTRPTVGDSWHLALNRGQQCASPRLLGGWPNGGGWHNIENMGTLHFA